MELDELIDLLKEKNRKTHNYMGHLRIYDDGSGGYYGGSINPFLQFSFSSPEQLIQKLTTVSMSKAQIEEKLGLPLGSLVIK